MSTNKSAAVDFLTSAAEKVFITQWVSRTNLYNIASIAPITDLTLSSPSVLMLLFLSCFSFYNSSLIFLSIPRFHIVLHHRRFLSRTPPRLSFFPMTLPPLFTTTPPHQSLLLCRYILSLFSSQYPTPLFFLNFHWAKVNLNFILVHCTSILWLPFSI